MEPGESEFACTSLYLRVMCVGVACATSGYLSLAGELDDFEAVALALGVCEGRFVLVESSLVRATFGRAGVAGCVHPSVKLVFLAHDLVRSLGLGASRGCYLRSLALRHDGCD